MRHRLHGLALIGLVGLVSMAGVKASAQSTNTTTTVTFNLRSMAGFAQGRAAYFAPDNGITTDATNLYWGGAIGPVYATNGALTVALEPNGYTMKLEGLSTTAHIVVPTGGGTYNGALLGTNILTWTTIGSWPLYGAANLQAGDNTTFRSAGGVTYIDTLAGGGSVTSSGISNALGYVPAAAGTNDLKQISIERFGVKHDGRQLVGTVANGSQSVTLSSGTVSAADVGAPVRVRFGVGPNQDLVTPIAAVADSAHFTLTAAVSTNVAGGDIMVADTDDSPLFQAALTQFAATGLWVKCPPGIYRLDSQINFPAYSSASGWAPGFVIEGAVPMQLNNTAYTTETAAVPAGATVFWFGQQVGNGGAMFGTAESGTHGRVLFRNVIFRMPTNPNATALDGNYLLALSTENCRWDTGGFAEYDPRLPAPTYPSIAVRYPANNNYGGGTMHLTDALIMGGFMHGVIHSEHLRVNGAAVLNCMNGFSPTNASFDCPYSGVSIEGCLNPLNGGTNSYGGSSLYIMALHVENSLPGWWHTGTLINDPSHKLHYQIWMDNATAWTNTGAIYGDLTTMRDSTDQTLHNFGGWTTFGNSNVMFVPNPTYQNVGEIVTPSASAERGIVVKPWDNSADKMDFIVAPVRDYAGTSAMSWLLQIPANQSELAMKGVAGAGSNPNLGVPLRFYPIAGLSYGLSIETNGNIVAGRGQFTGDGSGLTGTAAMSISGNAATATAAAGTPWLTANQSITVSGDASAPASGTALSITVTNFHFLTNGFPAGALVVPMDNPERSFYTNAAFAVAGLTHLTTSNQFQHAMIHVYAANSPLLITLPANTHIVGSPWVTNASDVQFNYYLDTHGGPTTNALCLPLY